MEGLEKLDNGETNPAAGMGMWGFIALASGAAILGTGSGVFSNLGSLSVISGGISAAGGSTSGIVGLQLMAFGAIGSVLVGLLGIASSFIKKRPIAIAMLGLGVILGALEVGGAALFMQLSNDSYYILDKNNYNSELTSQQRALSNWISGVFNSCCAPYKSNPALNLSNYDYEQDVQSAMAPCPTATGLAVNDPQVCSTLPKVLESTGLGNYTALLCNCYDPSTSAAITSYITSNGVCTALTKVSVPMDSNLAIPTLPFTFTLFTALKNVAEAKDFLQYFTTFGMTGYPGPPNATNGGNGFNCGIGYVKGVAWIQEMFLDQIGKTAMYVAFGAGGLQIVATIMVIIYWFMARDGGSSAGWMDYEASGSSKKEVAPVTV